MCRLFGFRSVILSQVHQSLVHADNALQLQAGEHPDGWGVAYYVEGTPHLIKSDNSALSDKLFQKVSGLVSSETVIAHIRKATHGEINILNTHPFQYGHWIFAHNGHIKNFDQHKDEILQLISPRFKRFILGSTDSEIFFYFLLTFISVDIELESKNIPIDVLTNSVKKALKELKSIIGPICEKDILGNRENYLTFLISNGTTMLAYQGGKNLIYSTYKKKCVDRDSCPSFSPECEAPSKKGNINHLIFSSEELSGDNIWLEMKPGDLIGVDANMIFHKDKVK